jgi:hypothetical protein
MAGGRPPMASRFHGEGFSERSRSVLRH